MALGNLDVHHVGAVVEHLETSMDVMSRDLGLTWAAVQEIPLRVRRASGEVLVEHLRFTYSQQGTPYLELIESREGKLWPAGPPGAVHHLGAFAADLRAESARLARSGLALEFGGGRGEQPAGFAYHLAPAGVRIELVDGANRGDFERWLAGGSLVGE